MESVKDLRQRVGVHFSLFKLSRTTLVCIYGATVSKIDSSRLFSESAANYRQLRGNRLGGLSGLRSFVRSPLTG